jgi:Transcriptional regulator containing an amidase domain and an AraC-type DNA-binding HTH domain
MSVKSCSLQIDIKQREIDNRGTPMFPCGGYTTILGEEFMKCIPWHWHEEIEVLFVTNGTIKIDMPNQTIIVKTGESVFVNSNVLHTATNIDECTCKIESFVFNPSLVFGSIESVIEQKYVRPLINCQELSAIHFKNKIDWHREITESIKEAFAKYQKEAFGYELFVKNHLSRLWFLIASNNQKLLEREQDIRNVETKRVKNMITYIHTHYENIINLKNIADSAIISERECLRCFNKVLRTTPMKYLLNYRVSVAGKLLINSDSSIAEICRATGFESPSYFSLKFKSLIEMTPSEYRQQSKKIEMVGTAIRSFSRNGQFLP